MAGLALTGAGCLFADNSADKRVPPTPVTTTPPVQTATSTSLTTKKGETDRIRVSMPMPGALVTRPLRIAGEVRGWYFEGSFPVRILNKDGRLIASGIATAKGDWMTDGWVPFTGTIDYPPQTPGSTGTIVFTKDNPSGLPEHDDSAELRITF